MKSALVVCVLALRLPLAAEARTGATPGRGGAGADPGRPGADHLRPGELPLAPGRFDAWVGTILELTDAQLALAQAQNTQAQAPSDYRIALAQLDRAAGRRSGEEKAGGYSNVEVRADRPHRDGTPVRRRPGARASVRSPDREDRRQRGEFSVQSTIPGPGGERSARAASARPLLREGCPEPARSQS